MADLTSIFDQLAREGRAPAEDWPAGEDPGAYGLLAHREWIVPEGRYDPLRAERIRQGLSRRAREWLRELDIRSVIGSTNAELMERARRQPVEGTACLAEIQLQGRGRRGRSWASPFGSNLALSIGVAVDRPASALGGVSVVVGLAVLDALEQLDVDDLSLKWPNDVLLRGRKLGGILIEMSQERGTELVIGVGLNVSLPERIRLGLDQEVADLSARVPPPSRNELAARVVSSAVEFVGEFDNLGFGPFKAAFDERHCHHGHECEVIQGERRIPGVVAGVTDEGELLLQTADGPRTFHSGEVSLRRSQ